MTHLCEVLGLSTSGDCAWLMRPSPQRAQADAMATHLQALLVRGALEVAVQQRQPEAVIHHSDQGCQSTSTELGLHCRAAGVSPSTGSAGECDVNAMCKSFSAHLECELRDQIALVAKPTAKLEVFCFIEGWTNPRRRHSALGHLSPVDFGTLHRNALEAA